MKTFHILAACSLLISTPVFAQVDGILGDTSTGSLDVSFTVAPAPDPQIQITGLENIDFGSFIDGDTLPGEQSISNICVQGSNAVTYSIQIFGQNNPDGSNSGILMGATEGGPTATYSAVYSDFDGVSTSSGLALASGLGEPCAADELSTLALTLGELTGVGTLSESETLTDILTLTVSPE